MPNRAQQEKRFLTSGHGFFKLPYVTKNTGEPIRIAFVDSKGRVMPVMTQIHRINTNGPK